MLEQPLLVVYPWNSSGHAEGVPRMAIADPASPVALGFAYWRTPGGGRTWLRWFTRSVLEIRENEDEPLLCTVHPSLCRRSRWEVRDADERLVGRVVGRVLLDRRERLLAELDWSSDDSTGSFQHPEQGELAILKREPTHLQLAFAPRGVENPFVRMVLLAATLVLVVKDGP